MSQDFVAAHTTENTNIAHSAARLFRDNPLMTLNEAVAWSCPPHTERACVADAAVVVLHNEHAAQCAAQEQAREQQAQKKLEVQTRKLSQAALMAHTDLTLRRRQTMTRREILLAATIGRGPFSAAARCPSDAFVVVPVDILDAIIEALNEVVRDGA